MKILITEPLDYSSKALEIYQNLGQVELGPLDEERLAEIMTDIDVLVIRLGHQIDQTLLDHAQKLKYIVSPTTGLDHIDLDTAIKKGIKVISLKGESDFLRTIPATAELTWGLLLALVRHIPQAFQSVQEGNWDRDSFHGHDLAGKTLGILGLGRIGEKTARYGLAFGMRVIAYDPKRKEWISGVQKAKDLRELLINSDVFFVHVPLDESTAHLIGKKEIELLPAGAILINTSRGAVVDEVALINELENHHLASAAVDVIENEHGNTAQSPMVQYAGKHDNLLITPHIGGATFESMALTEDFMAETLKRIISSELKAKE